MKRGAFISAIAALSILLAAVVPVVAVEPNEILPDPQLETRARGLSAELRCLVCQNQSIDDSNAPLAKDLRVLVRERLVAGDSDRQVLDYVVARYGAFVLLKPPLGWSTVLLWLAPVLVMLATMAAIASRLWARAPQPVPDLTDDERRRVEALLSESDGQPRG